MTPKRFRDVLLELVEENPFAIRAVLKILEVVFTGQVPTLAVTTGPRPRLLVNLEFVSAHCRGDAEAKAVICHEFLHVLLRHTEALGPLTPERHLAFDAVINAIIHRQLGPGASAMMGRYYAAERFPVRLLRPPTEAERQGIERRTGGLSEPLLASAWLKLYEGRLVADDIEELARDLRPPGNLGERLLGGHDELGRPVEGPLADALESALAQFNGSGIWRSPRGAAAGAAAYEALVKGADTLLRHWQRTTLQVLRRHLQPDPRARPNGVQPVGYRLPVLSSGDRRAFLRAQWAPFLPEASWLGVEPARVGTAQVYLDASGSMNAELPLVIALLARLSRHIRRPFWAFSDEVAPAVIERGQLRTLTTGGTSLACVLAHVARTRPGAAVIVTDGYVDRIDPGLVAAASRTRLHALVTRDGNPAALQRAGLPYTQLERLPS